MDLCPIGERPWRFSVNRFKPALILAVAFGVLSFSAPVFDTPAQAITQSDVDAACASSAVALAEYEASRTAFNEVALDLDQTRVAVLDNTAKLDRTESLVERQVATVDELEAAVLDQADELYMQAVSSPSFLLLDSPEELIMAGELLDASSSAGLAALDNVTAARSDLEHFSGELTAVANDLADLETQQTNAMEAQMAAMEQAGAAYDRLDDECKQARIDFAAEQERQRQEELARQRAEEEARQKAAQEAAAEEPDPVQEPEPQAPVESPPVVGGFVCPMTPGHTQFIDSWGYPRSGGRTHQGTDMMAPWDEPVFAVESGVIDTDSGGIGGNHIWLAGDSGTGYYYAHLNGFAVSDGTRVAQGDLIGYNGATGNAAGGAPHVHFQLHPGGRSSSAVNPYPTLAAACF
jgi:murein DD-endopeptidase MepM/ murein hydrolase activator NlpD